MIKKVVFCFFCFIYCNVFIKKKYDRNIFTGKAFKSPHGAVFAQGWRIMYRDYRDCNKKDINTDVRWPVSPDLRVLHPENITFDPDDLNNFQTFGCYYQAIGKITIGKGTYIAPNVGLITANHNPLNPDEHLEAKPIYLGEKCWIGMNSVILPGVTLGANTVVGAGSVVTKSFPEGRVVIAGNPAKIIKTLD